MTKGDRDYSQAKVYKLCSRTSGHYYIGSTCQPLHKRLHAHRTAVGTFTSRVYKFFEEQSRDNMHIVLIAEFPETKSKSQLVQHEQAEIDKHRDDPMCLNTVSAHVDPEVYRLRGVARAILCAKKRREEEQAYYRKRYQEQGTGTGQQHKEHREANRHQAYKDMEDARSREWSMKRCENAQQVCCLQCHKKIKETSLKQHCRYVHDGIKDTRYQKIKHLLLAKTRCPHCDKEMCRTSINMHIKRKHRDGSHEEL